MITVIIPVYNTERYLKRCIESVLRSAYQDFEIILINDGSIDQSREICEQYCDSDNRIRLLNQRNTGASTARNRGIDESQGEWLVFVDSDDMVSEHFLGTVAQERFKDLDLLIFDCEKIVRGRKAKTSGKPDPETRMFFFTEEDAPALIEKMLTGRLLQKSRCVNLRSPGAKAYKKRVIDQYGIRFPVNIFIGEDQIFNLEYLIRVKAGAYIGQMAYLTEWRPGSVTHSFQPNFIGNYYLFQKTLKSLMKEYDIFDALEGAYHENVLASMTEVLINGIFDPRNNRTRSENRELFREVREYENYKYAMRYSITTGPLPRKILFLFFNLRCYDLVNIISRISFFLLTRIHR